MSTNSEQNVLRINHDSIERAFHEHLTTQNNERILFTAPFGAGKSTFLTEFFHKNEVSYFTLKLYPVNYSVSQNEDIFELIKFDILLQLVALYRNEIELEREDFSIWLSSQVFITKRLKVMPFLNAVLALSGKVGKSAVELLKAINDTIDDFKEFHDEIQIDGNADIERFLKAVERRKGSVYEMDGISVLIADLISRVKLNKSTANPGVESVLIIDDLDRLDPEHTFRLFNIFSTHLGDLHSGNKFGVDQVIFVCDYENIWKLYKHRYGSEVDFKGYIDKFYSYAPFAFDNRKYISQEIDAFIGRLRSNSTRSGQTFLHLIKRVNRFPLYDVIRWLLLSLISARLLNLRTLMSEGTLEFPDYSFGRGDREISECDALYLFHLLNNFYHSFEVVKAKLDLLADLYSDETPQRSSDLERHYSNRSNIGIKSVLLPFLIPREIGLKRFFEKDDPRSAFSESLNVWLHFEPEDRGAAKYERLIFKKATKDGVIDSNEVALNPYRMLATCFDECRKIGALG